MANPTLLEMPIARDGAKNSIPSTTSPTTGLLSQQFGWQDINSMPVQQGGKAPSRLDFNGVLNLLSNILFYSQKGWQFEWDSSQAYYAGCIVKDTSDGKMYMCLNDVTSTTAPHADATNWQLWDLSMLANYLPLAGGTLSGDLKTSANIYKSNDTGVFDIRAGNDLAEDGGIRFIGKNQGGANAGASFLYGAKGTNPASPYVGIRTDGSLVCSQTGLGMDERDLGGSAIVGESLTEPGYKKTADGLIIQWGAVASGTSSTVTLPIAFTTRYNVVASSSSDVLTQVTTKTDSLSQFTIRSDNACAKSWFAIGV